MTTHELVISEPWDFEFPNKTNRIKVVGVGYVEGPNKLNWGKRYYLIEPTDSFEVNGETVEKMLVSPRDKGDSFDLVEAAKCIVGIARLLPGAELFPGDQVDVSTVDYWAIGSIERSSKTVG